MLGLSRAWIQREPLGVVLVIGPWNYPFHLTLIPLIGAIAAGNAVVLKPSEVAQSSSRLLAQLVAKYLDTDAIRVAEGGVAETTELLEHPWDHIFYTGNGVVGSIVMEAAAKHLSPVTLELGGKSPVWVDDSHSIEKTARTLAWGKFTNCGQTCVAPDYVLTNPDVAPRLAGALKVAIREYYSVDPSRSPDYGQIITERHAERLAAYLSQGTRITDGEPVVSERYIPPTILTDVEPTSPVMLEEIFGPILPIVVVDGIDDTISFIRSRPKPLALYAFTQREDVRSKILAGTTSGGLAFNTVMSQLSVPSLPFGGVGSSGMGAYHGEHSVRLFSHERAVLRMLRGPDLTSLARPPFDARKIKMLTGTSENEGN